MALWKRVEALKAWGYGIEAGRRGYELARDDGLAPADLEDARDPAFLPMRVLSQAGSTMDEARAWGYREAPSGASVLAIRQSAGRGRGGREWRSPPGGLYLSLVLRSSLPPACAGALILETASLLLGILEMEGIRGVSFRWPNDIVSGTRKLGGLLLESFGGLDRADFYVLGIGLNSSPIALEDRPAAGLEELAPRAPRRRDLARALSASLRGWCENPALEPRRWAGLEPSRDRPARAELWDGRSARLLPRGYTPRGELACAGRELPLAFGECRKMTYEGEIS